MKKGGLNFGHVCRCAVQLAFNLNGFKNLRISSKIIYDWELDYKPVLHILPESISAILTYLYSSLKCEPEIQEAITWKPQYVDD